MAGSNRTAGLRNMKDRTKRNILNMPVEARRVQRRVKDDQVSSYSLRVHRRAQTRQAEIQLLQDRNIDPGEAELELVNHQYRSFVTDSAINRPDVVIKSVLHRINGRKIKLMAVALLGRFVQLDMIDSFELLLTGISVKDRKDILEVLGRSTWRRIVRQPEFRALHRFFGSNKQFLGELALNANSIYRQGTDVMKLILPHLDNILDDIDYAELGEQQLFNTRSPNLIPSNVYPTDAYGVNELYVGGSASKVTWVHSPPLPTSNLLDQIDEQLGVHLENKGKITAFPMGFLPRYRSQALNLKSDGLSNSTLNIPLESINKVLAGFVLYNDKDDSLFVNPTVGRHQLTPDESKLRQKMFSLTSKRPTNIIKQIKEKGDSGYGENEVDIYNNGQYAWYRGKRNQADDQALITSLFPHPLLRHISIGYRDADTDIEVSDKLCGLTLATLPLIPK